MAPGRARPYSAFEVAAAYAGTVVGAGFASGQEVLRFFTLFGARGSWGLLVATALLMWWGVAALERSAALGARSHRDLLEAAGGRWLGRLADAVVTAFLLAGTGVMLAGSGAIAAEQFRLPEPLGSSALAVAAAGTVLLGLRGVVRATAAVMPVLLLSVAVLALATLLGRPPAAGTPPALRAAAPSWWLAGLLYAGYNLVLALSVLAPLGAAVPRQRVRLLGGTAGGLALGGAAYLIHAALRARLPEVAAFEVPMLVLARDLSPAVAGVYALVLWAEVYTTAVASLFGLVARIVPGGGPAHAWATLALTAAAWALSRLGFAELVTTLYPAVGYLGLAVFPLLAFRRPAG